MSDSTDSISASTSSWRRKLSLTAALGLFGITFYYFRTLVQEYGWQGAFNYIWEGDPYPDIRHFLDALESYAKQLNKEHKTVNVLVEALERGQLNTVDSAGDEAILKEWQNNLPKTMDLKKTLGALSHKLDHLASKIDAIPGAQDPILKNKKKELSEKIATLMEQADRLLGFLQRASLPQ